MTKMKRTYRAATVCKYFVDGTGKRSEYECFVVRGSLSALKACLERACDNNTETSGILSYEIHEERYTAQEAKWFRLEA